MASYDLLVKAELYYMNIIYAQGRTQWGSGGPPSPPPLDLKNTIFSGFLRDFFVT